MYKSRFFSSRKLFDNVTIIAGISHEQCYLIEGKDKALLIDTLTGIGSLKAYVRELTDLPVIIVNTHGHLDHCGGNFEYETCYIHPADIQLMYNHGDPEMKIRFAGTQGTRVLPEDIVPARPLITLPIRQGDIIDLGGVRLEVIEVPGHTAGTIVLLDRQRRIVYSGDACNVNTLIAISDISIEEYRESLLALQDFRPDFDVLYGGHGDTSVPAAIIDEAVALCDEIMAGTDDAEESSFLGRPFLYGKKKNEKFQRLDGKLANIAYVKDRIFKKPAEARIIK